MVIGPFDSAITLMTEPQTLVLTSGGVELANTRRLIDFVYIEAARCQWQATSAAVAVRLEGSLDEGTTWTTLVDPETGIIGPNPYVIGWSAIPATMQYVDVLVRAVGVGSSLLTTIQFVEMQYR